MTDDLPVKILRQHSGAPPCVVDYPGFQYCQGIVYSALPEMISPVGSDLGE